MMEESFERQHMVPLGKGHHVSLTARRLIFRSLDDRSHSFPPPPMFAR